MKHRETWGIKYKTIKTRGKLLQTLYPALGTDQTPFTPPATRVQSNTIFTSPRGIQSRC